MRTTERNRFGIKCQADRYLGKFSRQNQNRILLWEKKGYRIGHWLALESLELKRKTSHSLEYLVQTRHQFLLIFFLLLRLPINSNLYYFIILFHFTNVDKCACTTIYSVIHLLNFSIKYFFTFEFPRNAFCLLIPVN